MKIQEAMKLARDQFGETAVAILHSRSFPIVGFQVGTEIEILGVGPTFEAAFEAVPSTLTARLEVKKAIGPMAYAVMLEDTQAEVGLEIEGKKFRLARGASFEIALERAMKCPAAKSAREIEDVLMETRKRFGSNAKLEVSATGDCHIVRGGQWLGIGASWRQAFDRAKQVDNNMLDRWCRDYKKDKNGKVQPRNKHNGKPHGKYKGHKPKYTKPATPAPQPTVLTIANPATGALELGQPAADPSEHDEPLEVEVVVPDAGMTV